MKIGNHEEALDKMKNCLKLSKNYLKDEFNLDIASILSNIAFLYMKVRKFKEAEE